MATINELKDVLKESLEEKGVLQEIRAKIRAFEDDQITVIKA